MCLPHEVLVQITDYLDIPSIGAVTQTSKAYNGSISQIVTSEDTWFNIANARFNILSNTPMSEIVSPSSETPKKSKPKYYGGRNWQDAYRNMSLSNRIPKMSVLFRKKSTFAKGTGHLNMPLHATNETELNICSDSESRSDNSSSNRSTSLKEEEKPHLVQTEMKKSKHQIMNTWVMINHTEDCNLRYIPNDRNRIGMVQFLGRREIADNNSHGNVNTDANTPYIELQLAFQNTKSKFSTIDIDVMKTTVQMMCKKRNQNGDDNNGNDDYENHETSILTQRIIRKGQLQPKIIYRSVGGTVLYQESAKKSNRRGRDRMGIFSRSNQNDKKLYNYGSQDEQKDIHSIFTSMGESMSHISLNPFEFIVVSVNVPLKYYTQAGENLRFETDFLSRAISVCTPVTLHVETSSRPSDDDMSSSSPSLSSSSILSVAYFASEREIWENYTEISGNFIALNNRM